MVFYILVIMNILSLNVLNFIFTSNDKLLPHCHYIGGTWHLQGPQCQKLSFKIKLFYYCGVSIVLNYCLNHCDIPSAVFLLLEKTEFAIHVIDVQVYEEAS